MERKEHTRPRRPIGRSIEVLEPRDLPSALHALSGPAHVRAPSPGGGSAAPGRGAIVSLGSARLNLSGAAVTQASGAPTSHERLRENFKAVFYGPYIIGPPRFSGDVSQTYTNSGGTASAFLHGNLQLGFQTPSAASQGPAGSATLFPKDYLMTGSFLMLRLQGDPTDARDGRATSFNWSVTSASSGAFTNASGSGTLQLVYHPGPPDGGYLHAHGRGTGNVSAIFRGTLILDGTANPLRLNSA
jgi:hypothetical protein